MKLQLILCGNSTIVTLQNTPKYCSLNNEQNILLMIMVGYYDSVFIMDNANQHQMITAQETGPAHITFSRSLFPTKR